MNVWGNLIGTIQDILLPLIIFVVGGLAVMRGIKGRFMEMIILIGVTIIALVFFLNPGIIEGLATSIGGEVSGAVGGGSGTGTI